MLVPFWHHLGTMGPFWPQWRTICPHVSTFGIIWSLWAAFLTPCWHLWAPFGTLGLHFSTFGAPFGTFWTPFWRHMAPSVPFGGLLAPQVQNEVHVGVQKSPKWSQKVIKNIKKRHQGTISKTDLNIPRKNTKTYIKNVVFQRRFKTKNSLHPKGPHSLKPTYFLWINEVHVGQRRKRKSKENLREQVLQRSNKHRTSKEQNIKNYTKKTPKVSRKASKRLSKNTLENTSNK